MLPQLSVLTMLGICSYEDLKNRRKIGRASCRERVSVPV